MVILRPTSNYSGGLVFWVEGAAAASVLRHDLAAVALDEGEVVRFLRDTHRIHICLDETQCRPTLGPYLVFTSDTLVGFKRFEGFVEQKCKVARFFHNLMTCMIYFHPFSLGGRDNNTMHI